MTDPDRFSVSVPRITSDEAVELIAHHLGLAAAYFEAVSEDHGANAREIKRILEQSVEGDVRNPTLPAALNFYQTMVVEYDKIARENDE